MCELTKCTILLKHTMSAALVTFKTIGQRRCVAKGLAEEAGGVGKPKQLK